jgi:hypothetical protein
MTSLLPSRSPQQRNNAGWWLSPTPLKNDGVRQWVSDDIPLYEMENKVMFETTNQNVTFPSSTL